MDADDTFDALFRRYEEPICSYLASLTGDPARARELAQETFLRAYRAISKGERWDNPRAWLYRVASRLATDDYRRRRLVQWLPLWGADGKSNSLRTGGRSGFEDTTIERLAVQAALEALSPRYRVPLVLYVYEECTVAEVAEMLELSVSAVKMRLSRGREMFRRAYQQEDVG